MPLLFLSKSATGRPAATAAFSTCNAAGIQLNREEASGVKYHKISKQHILLTLLQLLQASRLLVQPVNECFRRNTAVVIAIDRSEDSLRAYRPGYEFRLWYKESTLVRESDAGHLDDMRKLKQLHAAMRRLYVLELQRDRGYLLMKAVCSLQIEAQRR
jgi:hypothetical protein